MPSILPSVLIVAAVSSAVGAAVATPRYFTVHKDHLDPAKVDLFVGARREWLRAVRERRISDRRGFFLQVGASAFYSFNGFETFADVDALRRGRREAAEAMGEASTAYDRGDAALVAPHASEIWVRDENFDYIAPGAPASLSFETAPSARMVIEQIRPGTERGEAQYEATWREIREALTRARYPLTRATYFSMYGTGKYTTFWLAPTREALAAAPSVEDALVAAVGTTQARALLCRIAECVVESERFDVTRRTDLDSPR